MKFGEAEPEAVAMDCVRQNATIPVPKIHFAFGRGNWGYIVLDFINADSYASETFIFKLDVLFSWSHQWVPSISSTLYFFLSIIVTFHE